MITGMLVQTLANGFQTVGTLFNDNVPVNILDFVGRPVQIPVPTEVADQATSTVTLENGVTFRAANDFEIMTASAADRAFNRHDWKTITELAVGDYVVCRVKGDADKSYNHTGMENKVTPTDNDVWITYYLRVTAKDAEANASVYRINVPAIHQYRGFITTGNVIGRSI
jgi:hypothetical protein